MDISGLTSGYNEIYGKIAEQSTSRLEEGLKGDLSKADDEKLMDACKQFEAYFLEQVFKEMQKTVKIDQSDSTQNSMLDFFKDQTIQKIAADSTEHQSLGLAQMLYEQMKRNYDA